MKPSTELFSLIKTLTKSEKRFFKLNSSLQQGEKNYLKIFDFIEKQKLYNEDDLKNYFKDEKFILHLPSEKNHLYKLVLKSLRSYYSDHTISSQLKQEIKNVEILYKKALYKECEKYVKRAKEIATEYEKFYYWFELINWEKKLMEEAYEEGQFNHNLDDLIHEETEVIEKLRNLGEYHILYSKINLIFRTGGFTRNTEERKIVDEIADYHLIKGKNTAISVRATSICYYIKGLCAASKRDYEDALVNFKKSKSVMDGYTKIKSDLQNRYINTLSFLINCYIDLCDFEHANIYIKELELLSDEKNYDNLDAKVKIFSHSNISKIKIYNKTGQFKKAEMLFDSIDEGMNDFGDKMNKEKKLLFTYNQSYTCFGLTDYKKALKYLNTLLNDNEKQLRQDVYSFARIFNLIIHYELKNYDLIDYEIKSTTRFLNKLEKDYQIENVCIKFIKKLAKEESEKSKSETFLQFKEEVEKLLKESFEQVILEYFDILAWINSKIKQISFEESINQNSL